MATLWQTAEIKNCVYCGKPAKVWASEKAWAIGENTDKAPYGEIDMPYISPTNSERYEGVCNICSLEDVYFRFRVMMTGLFEKEGKPIPDWIWKNTL
jgi:hypothetical protein